MDKEKVPVLDQKKTLKKKASCDSSSISGSLSLPPVLKCISVLCSTWAYEENSMPFWFLICWKHQVIGTVPTGRVLNGDPHL